MDTESLSLKSRDSSHNYIDYFPAGGVHDEIGDIIRDEFTGCTHVSVSQKVHSGKKKELPRGDSSVSSRGQHITVNPVRNLTGN